MSGSKFVLKDVSSYEASLSYTQKLDAFLDQYEEKYGLENADKNLETSSNNETLMSEKDMRIWETAKGIKRSNESYRTVLKLLRDLQSNGNGQSKYSQHLVTKQFSRESTTSCSSDGSWTNENFPRTQYSTLPYRKNSGYKHASSEVMKPKQKINKDQTILEAGGVYQSKSVMVAKKEATKIPIVLDKSKMTKSFRYKLNNPVKNPPLPSLEEIWPMPIQCKPQSLRPAEVIDQKMVKIREKTDGNIYKDIRDIGDTSYTTDENNFQNSVGSLLGGLLDHSKTVFMKILNIPESQDLQQQQKVKNHFMKNKKQEFQIGSVLGAPFIPGMRHLPMPTYIKSANNTISLK